MPLMYHWLNGAYHAYQLFCGREVIPHAFTCDNRDRFLGTFDLYQQDRQLTFLYDQLIALIDSHPENVAVVVTQGILAVHGRIIAQLVLERAIEAPEEWV